MSPRMQKALLQGGAAIVGIALLALAMWVYERQPAIEAETMKPIRSEGRIGKVAGNPVFSIKIESVQAARSMATYSKKLGTDGVFLIVQGRVRAEREPFTMGKVSLESHGRIYRDSPRIGLNDTFMAEFQPLLWGPMNAVFELPIDRLPGARLILSEGGRPSTQLAAEASVDLGLTDSKTTELLAKATDGFTLQRS